MKRSTRFLHLVFILGLAVGLLGPVAPGAAAQDATPSAEPDVAAAEQAVADADGDGVADEEDGCPDDPDADQTDSDRDGEGDACDESPYGSDDDNDGLPNDNDNCDGVANSDQANADGDQDGDACDETPFGPDDDGDGLPNDEDNCDDVVNPDQANVDGDEDGDACDGTPLGPDADGDGAPDDDDNCPEADNPDQSDSDGDGDGDACDETPNGPDADGDGVTDEVDNCDDDDNLDQADTDGDGGGDACDETPNGDPPAAEDVSVVYAAAGADSYEHGRDDAGARFREGEVFSDLDGADVACGDVVVFLQAVTTGSGLAVAPASDVQLTTTFDRRTTEGNAIGFAEVFDVRINNLGIDGDGDGEVDDLADPANANLDGDETVAYSTEASSDEQLVVKAVVRGLNFGERVILRYELSLECDEPAAEAAGEIQTTLARAEVVDGDAVEVGEQTLRLKNAGRIQDPDVEVSIACPELPDGARVGNTIVYRVTVENTGTVDLSALGLASSRPDGRLDDEFASPLAPGKRSTREFVDTIGADDALAGNVDLAVEIETAEGARSRAESLCGFVPVTALDLQATAGDPAALGDEVMFRYEVVNSGDLPLRDVFLQDDNGTPNDVSDDLPIGACEAATLAAGASVRCTATTTVNAADVAAGSITRTVSADAAETEPVRRSVAAEVVQHPSLAVTVAITDGTSGVSEVSIGQAVSIVYTVTNSGDVPLAGVALVNIRRAAVVCPEDALPVGGSLTCVVTETVVADDALDADGERRWSGGVVTATARAGQVVTATAKTAVVVSTNPALNIVTTATDGESGVTSAVLGQEIIFVTNVTNTGDVPLRGISVEDDNGTPDDPSDDVSVPGCAGATLAVGAAVECRVTAAVTSRQVAAGALVHIFRVDSAETEPRSTAVGLTVLQHPDLSLAVDVTEGASPLTSARIGGQVTVVYRVVNTGDVPLRDVRVIDDAAGEVACPATSVAANWSITCTRTLTVSETDVHDGDGATLRVGATVAATSSAAGDVAAANATSFTVSTNPRMALAAEVAAGPFALGDRVTITYRLRNTGDVGLSGVTLDDTRVGPVPCVEGRLAAGAEATCAVTYAVAAADVAAGRIETAATVRAPGVEPATATTSLTVTQHAEVTFDVVAVDGTAGDDLDQTALGQTVTLTFTLMNAGDVALSDVAVDVAGPEAVACPEADLAVDASMVCTATHEVTLDDVAAGRLAFTATADTAETAPVTAGDTLAVDQNPAMTLSVTATDGIEEIAEAELGQAVTYFYVVKNTGDVPLQNIGVVDDNGTLDNLDDDVVVKGCATASLESGASVTCAVEAVVTQAEVDAGELVRGGVADSDETEPAAAGLRLPVAQHPALALKVQATDGTEEVAEVGIGATITFVYTVHNTGDVSLSELTLVDERSEVIDCRAASLAPGDAVVCEATLVAKEAHVRDEDGAALSVAATATALAPAGDTVEASGEATLSVRTQPGLALGIEPGVETASLDDVVELAYTLTNTGDISLTEVSLSYDRPEEVSCPSDTIAVGETMTCTATDTVTAADVVAGTIDVSAEADAAEVDPVATGATVTVAQHPGLSLTVQSTDGSAPITSAAPGDTVTYIFAVANTGDLPLKDLSVEDETLPAVECLETELEIDDGADGGPDETTCTTTTTYVVTEEDAVAGALARQATARASTPSGGTVTATAEHELAVEAHPSLALALVATDGQDEISSASIGQTITLLYRVRNEGDIALKDVAVTHEQPGPVTCPKTTLAAGAAMECSATLTVTEAVAIDEDGPELRLAARVTGTPAVGDAVSDAREVTLTVVTAPKLSLAVVPSATTATLGETVTYTFTVGNSGDLGLTGIALTDDRLTDVTCPAATLAVGTTMTCSTASTIVSAEDVTAGRITTETTATSVQAAPVSVRIEVVALAPPIPTQSPTATVTATATATATATTAPPTKVPPTPVATQAPGPGGGGGNTGGSGTGSGSTGGGDTGGGDAGGGTGGSGAGGSNGGEATGGGAGTGAEEGAGGGGSETGGAAGAPSDATGEETTDQYDCIDLLYEAQAVLDEDPSDPHNLDGDDDGIACEEGDPSTLPSEQGELEGGSPTPTATPELPELTLDLRPGAASANLNDKVSYTYTVRNAGNVDLTNVTVLDDEVGTVQCPATTLAVGATVDCTATAARTPHTVTLEDVARGKVDNVATADSDQTEPVTDSASFATIPHAKIAVDKTCPAARETGEPLHLEARLTNPGDIALRNVTVVDDLGTPDDSRDDVTLSYRGGDVDRDRALDPGETWTYDGSYVVGSSPAAEAATVNVSGVGSQQTKPDGELPAANNDTCTTRIHWGDEGCSAGFWLTHTDLWDGKGGGDVTTTIQGNIPFNSLFAVTPAQSGLDNDVTLLGAMETVGGGEMALARYAAGAVASADARIAFRYRVAEVMTLYRDAVDAQPGPETVESVLAKPSAQLGLTCPEDLATRQLSIDTADDVRPASTPASTSPPRAAATERSALSRGWAMVSNGETGRMMLLGALPLFGLGGLGYRRYRNTVQTKAQRAERWR